MKTKQKMNGDEPKTTTTTTTSKTKRLGGVRPKKEKTVTRVYSDYPLKRKNLLKKTTVVNKALPTKDVVKTKTKERMIPANASGIRSELGAVTTKVQKEKKVRDFSKGYTKERKVTRDNSGMLNPLAGSERRNKTVSKSFKKENNNNALWTPKNK